MVTEKGSQILINFKELAMLQPLDSSECARQSVRMVDTESDDRYIIPNQFFCGDLIPNFPGLSTFVSGNLSMCTFI